MKSFKVGGGAQRVRKMYGGLAAVISDAHEFRRE